MAGEKRKSGGGGSKGTNEFGRIFTSLVVWLGSRRRTQVFGRMDKGRIAVELG